MITKKVEQIQTGDVLAEDVILDGSVLISKGNILKEDYISNLKELNIEMVSVENEECENEDYLLSQEFIDEKYKTVKSIMERLIHGNENSLQELVSVAEEINEAVKLRSCEKSKFCIPSRSPDLYLHSIMVCALSCLLGNDMNLSLEDMKELSVGALLHDIGYRYVSSDFENIDLDTLPPGEVFELKKHTILGFSAIESQKWISDKSKMIILSHHERLDGLGYPLKQKSLNMETRIVCVCDGYDALISGNGYKLRQPEKAMETLRSWGNGIDGDVLKALEDRLII